MRSNNRFTFIDLFAGIGGFHLALHRIGGKCVYASEWDSYARKTYIHNFQKTEPQLFRRGLFTGDITEKKNKDLIPNDFDILCAGFPCQPFSQAGFKRGFEETRGTLFFDIAEIVSKRRPKAFLLENVRHLKEHDNGKTFAKITEVLIGLGYSFDAKILKASWFGLPTHRPRLYMVGFRDDIVDIDNFEFEFPQPVPLNMTMSDIFGANCNREIGFTIRVGGRGSGLNDRRNWDSYLVSGKERRLTYLEGKKMMGFPEDFEFPVSQVQALKQLGNSVAVNVIEMIGRNIVSVIKHEDNRLQNVAHNPLQKIHALAA